MPSNEQHRLRGLTKGTIGCCSEDETKKSFENAYRHQQHYLHTLQFAAGQGCVELHTFDQQSMASTELRVRIEDQRESHSSILCLPIKNNTKLIQVHARFL